MKGRELKVALAALNDVELEREIVVHGECLPRFSIVGIEVEKPSRQATRDYVVALNVVPFE